MAALTKKHARLTFKLLDEIIRTRRLALASNEEAERRRAEELKRARRRGGLRALRRRCPDWGDIKVAAKSARHDRRELAALEDARRLPIREVRRRARDGLLGFEALVAARAHFERAVERGPGRWSVTDPTGGIAFGFEWVDPNEPVPCPGFLLDGVNPAAWPMPVWKGGDVRPILGEYETRFRHVHKQARNPRGRLRIEQLLECHSKCVAAMKRGDINEAVLWALRLGAWAAQTGKEHQLGPLAKDGLELRAKSGQGGKTTGSRRRGAGRARGQQWLSEARKFALENPDASDRAIAKHVVSVFPRAKYGTVRDFLDAWLT